MKSAKSQVRLFLLNNAVIQTELNRTKRESGIENTRTEIEMAADKLIEDYIPQFDFEIRSRAKRMSEFYEIFYMLENDIRILIADTLFAIKGENWWNDMVPSNVRDNAQKNKEKELKEGITLRSLNQIEYSNFGELGEIIKQNWNVFAGIFSNSNIQGLERVMARLNLLRAPIAHCGVLSEDEVLRLKLTVKDWFKLMG